MGYVLKKKKKTPSFGTVTLKFSIQFDAFLIVDKPSKSSKMDTGKGEESG